MDRMRGTRLWIVIGLVALFALGLVAAGCGSDDDDSGSDTSTSASSGGSDVQTITEGTLLIGTDAPYPPFEIGTPDDADFSGFDIDLGNAIARAPRPDARVRRHVVRHDLPRRRPPNSSTSSIAASTITPGRQKTVNFSDPYYEAQQALVVPEGSDIASPDDLAGLIVGAQDATTGETFANDETDAAEVRGFPEGPDAIDAVITGQVDAAIIDQPVAADAVEKQGGIEIAAEIPTNELYGIAISKENPALLEAVNGALATIKDDGTIAGLYEKYFGAEPPDSVLNGTTHNPS